MDTEESLESRWVLDIELAGERSHSRHVCGETWVKIVGGCGLSMACMGENVCGKL